MHAIQLGTLDSQSLDKASDLALSLASVSFESALRGVQLLSSLTGGKFEVIVASVAGLLTFILTVLVFSDRRPRNEVLKAWPSQGPGLNKIPEVRSQVISRIFEPGRHVEKEQLELTDQLKGQLQKNWEGSSEPSRRNVVSWYHNPWHLYRAVCHPVMKLASNILISSTTQVTALFDRAVTHVQPWVSSFSRARTQSRCSCSCEWQRVAREGWADHVVSCLGWYPWQCKHCLTCSYFRRRRQT